MNSDRLRFTKAEKTGSKKRILSLIETVPLTVPVWVASFGAVAMFFLVLGKFYTWLVLPLGVLAATISAWCAHKLSINVDRPGKPKERVIVDVLAVVGIGLWLLCNIPFTSQHVFTNRDPAIYADAGAWLVHHDNLNVSEPLPFSDLPGMTAVSAGFEANVHNPTTVYAQGAHLLPAFLGLVGRLAGYHAMLHLNVLFGAIALLAVYGFARLVMKPRWAILAAASLALSLPLIYFSRDSYTEPLTLALIFSCLSMIWYARRTRRYSAWILAGISLGAGALARIDAYLPVAAVGAFLAIELITVKKELRWTLLRRAGAFAGAVGALGFLAWVDLAQLSSGYYRDLHRQYIEELDLVIGIVLLGAVAVGTTWRYPRLLLDLDRVTKKWRSPVVIVAVAAFFAFLVSRPLWEVTYSLNIVPGKSTRSYTELSLFWVLWYLPVLTLLGIAALAWIWARILKGTYLNLLPIMLVVSAESLLYFLSPNIAPDQIWAARRFLPIISPAFAVLGFFILGELYDKKITVLLKEKINLQIIAVVLATLAVASPLFVSYPFLLTRTYVPELAQVEAICNNLPRSAVLAWVADARGTMIEPTQAICGVPSFGVATNDPGVVAKELPELAATGRAKDKEVIIGISSTDLNSIPSQYRADMVPVSTITYWDLQTTYTRFPRNKGAAIQTIMLGELDSNAQIVPINEPK